jgi:hypothetical protein
LNNSLKKKPIIFLVHLPHTQKLTIYTRKIGQGEFHTKNLILF